jgi:hypothetical protein
MSEHKMFKMISGEMHPQILKQYLEITSGITMATPGDVPPPPLEIT